MWVGEFPLWHVRIHLQQHRSLWRRGFNSWPQRNCHRYSSDSIPSPGSSICHGCGHLKKKKNVGRDERSILQIK